MSARPKEPPPSVADVVMLAFETLPKHPSRDEWLAGLRRLAVAAGRVDPLMRAAARHEAAERMKACGVDATEAEELTQATFERASSRGAGHSRKKSADGARQGRPLELEDTRASEQAVDGGELFTAIRDTLKRYVVMPHGADIIVMLWIALTYLTGVVDVLARLLLTSPTRECGKSRLLTLVRALAHRAVPAVSISPAALFRVIEAESPTLVLDEMDNARLNENPELLALLNSGHTRSMAWTMRVTGEDHEPKRFSTWAPVALAAIGRLPDTIASRSVQVAMRRRAPGEPIARLRETKILAEMASFRADLTRWCRDHEGAIAAADPTIPQGLGDRDADNWTPLLAIAEEIGGDWPRLAREAAAHASGRQPEDAPGILLLADLRDLFFPAEAPGVDRLSSEDIVATLSRLDGRPWPDWRDGKAITKRGVAKLLGPFGIVPDSVRFENGTRKGYVREQFLDVFTRYLAPRSGTTEQASPTQGEAPAFDPEHEGSVPDQETESGPHENGRCSVVPDGNPAAGPAQGNPDTCPHCGATGRVYALGPECTLVCGACQTRLDAFMDDAPADGVPNV